MTLINHIIIFFKRKEKKMKSSYTDQNLWAEVTDMDVA